ncbi:DMT family transporter [Limnoglobus roseus]|uniref:EamA family transporter n=1 Tax=Limnoglobus roseus TaxID=2598579 RepID=A0A5C1AQI3_9BACT|nr:DMT family transporter [Limnoglobus roseus]QEL20002.1 EamA family transporter [Limnoglobus roseus]
MPLTLTPRQSARLTIILVAVLWSTGSLFMRLLQQPTALELDEPHLSPIQIAFYRSLFAGLCLLPLIRPRDCRVRPAMGLLVVTFAVMSALYLTALGSGSAANAILLQNTSPVWVYFLGIWFLGERADRRSLAAVLIGLLGAVVIVGGNWPREEQGVAAATQIELLLMGLGSGFTYAGVVLILRSLRNESPAWLTMLNLLGTAAMMGLFFACKLGLDGFWTWVTAPSGKQLAFLAFFGCVQLAVPYVLFARSLKTVSPNEASIITLLEPVLNPVWAYLIAPDRETPTDWTLIGGGLLLAALVWRYAPRPAAVAKLEAEP